MGRQPNKDVRLPAGLRVGDVIAGKYRVIRAIGRGGMGLVVEATHIHLGERVAIKLVLPRKAVRERAFDRLLREGRAAARIRSEHAVRVYDAGVLASGEPYIVFEYLDGIDLQALLRAEGKLPVDTAVRYVLEACEALAEAHALGIVHRDVKPANLFLARRSDGDQGIKVIDFGISKVAFDAPDGASMSALTKSRTVFGTPHYMAPEQMRSTRDVDARADVWSLGAVLHGLIAGEPPFRGETMVDVYARILAGPPSLRAARPEVSDGLDAIVRKCLRVERAHRYADVGDLAASLVEFAPPAARGAAERAILHARGARPSETGRVVADTLVDCHEATRTSDVVSESAATEITRTPSWARDGAGRRALPRPASKRASLGRWAASFVLASGVALAVGNFAGHATHSDDDAHRRAAIVPATSLHEAGAPLLTKAEALAVPSSQPLPSATVTATASASALVRVVAPQRIRVDPPHDASPAPTASTSASRSAPSVPGLPDTPD